GGPAGRVESGPVNAGRSLCPRAQLPALALACAAGLSAAGCSIEENYLDPDGPRYAGDHRTGEPAAGSRFLVVSYNLAYGREVEAAIDALGREPLAEVDLLLMQEMDPDGVDRIAAALGLAYVYYPASVKMGMDWGNAVLTRWPITSDHKVLLPHADPYADTRRIAVAAHIAVGGGLDVYSTHTATPRLGLRPRLDQADAILEDAAGLDGPTLVGGDLITGDPDGADQTLQLFGVHGFAWITDGASDTGSASGVTDVTLGYVFGRD